jgi:hypothetical protein
MCRESRGSSEERKINEEWVFIMSREPEISPEVYEEAKEALLSKYPEFELYKLDEVE